MKHLDLDLGGDNFEFSDASGEASLIKMPIMDEYPNPKNQFDVTFNAEGDNKDGQGEVMTTQEVDPNVVAGAIGAVAGAVGAIADGQDKSALEEELKLRCGRRPLIGKEKKRIYNECRDNFFNERSAFGVGGGSRVGGSQNQFIPTTQPERRGLSTGAVIGIVAGVALVGTLVFLAVRKK